MTQPGARFVWVWLLLGTPACASDAESVAVTRGALVVTENQKLSASDGEDYDFFGNAAAMSGDLAIVGADVEDGARGAAYVFERGLGGADDWGERKKLTAGDADDDDHFGWEVAISGDLAVMGAYVEDGAGNARGAAYVFERDLGGADNWGERKKLVASDAEDSDAFGYHVAISGDVVIVGARGEDGAGDNRGAAYVFERNLGGADNWGERRKLTAGDAVNGDRFGTSVAVAGDLVVVGASDKTGVTSLEGAAYVFERDLGGADNWGERKKLVASDAWNGDFLGSSAAISGDLAIVGAFFRGGGAAYVFERDLGGADNWGERKKLTASDAQPNDSFGGDVAISGDRVVVGASGEDGAGESRGAAYLFVRDLGGADNWGERKKLTASDTADSHSFGRAVAIAGDRAIVTATGDHGEGALRGAAYVFRYEDGPGVACSLDTQCASGRCAGGMCCDSDAGECTDPSGQEDAGATDAGDTGVAGDGGASDAGSTGAAGDGSATDAGGIGVGNAGTGGRAAGDTEGDAAAAHAGSGGGDEHDASGDGGCSCRIAGRAPSAARRNVLGIIALAFVIVCASRARRRATVTVRS